MIKINLTKVILTFSAFIYTLKIRNKLSEPYTTFSKKRYDLEGNQNKNNCLVSNFYNKLKSRALFFHLFRTEKSAGNLCNLL